MWLLVGLVLNPWTIAGLASPDGEINSPLTFGAIATFDVVLIALGLRILLRPRPINRRKLGFTAAMIVFSVLFAEGLLRVVDLFVPPGHADTPRYLRAAYRDKSWSKELFAELDDLAFDSRAFAYSPFIGWETTEFHREYVNVGSDGTRACWNPDFAPGAEPLSIDVFGGSTIWGMGVRDNFTIPSQLSRLLDSRGHPFEVHNYGDLAYTFTQELFNLILLLKDGHRPDYVIFYDGVNDVYAGYQYGTTGHVIDCFKLPEKFERRDNAASYLARGLGKLVEEHSRIYQYVLRASRPKSDGAAFPEKGAHFDDAALRRLGTDIADFYASSQRMLEPLSREYGFEYVCLWQPVSLLEDHLLPGEREDIRITDTKLGKLHRYVIDELRDRDLPNFIDLTDVLADRDAPYYFDYCHLTKDGNHVVAERICNIVEQRFTTAR